MGPREKGGDRPDRPASPTKRTKALAEQRLRCPDELPQARSKVG
jgi:hypothetical protein